DVVAAHLGPRLSGLPPSCPLRGAGARSGPSSHLFGLGVPGCRSGGRLPYQVGRLGRGAWGPRAWLSPPLRGRACRPPDPSRALAPSRGPLLVSRVVRGRGGRGLAGPGGPRRRERGRDAAERLGGVEALAQAQQAPDALGELAPRG